MNLQPKQERITRTYTIESDLYRQVKQCANQDGRILSRIIENYLTRYVQSKT
jgi:hypothetical protein